MTTNDSWRTFARRLAMAALLAPAASLTCHASLGSAPSTFPDAGARAVRAHALAASNNSTAGNAAYNVTTTVLAGGTTVREYAGADGTVFAVSWTGPFMPDLRTLLGDQFATMTAASAKRPMAGNSQLHVERPDVTIESTGHMRAYAGRAWLNAKLPAGFSTNDIK